MCFCFYRNGTEIPTRRNLNGEYIARIFNLPEVLVSFKVFYPSFAGPDAVVPATQLICTDITGAVKIRDSDAFSVPHISVATSLKLSAEKYKDHPAFRHRASLQQPWNSVSYE